ncbi:hypothetical protein NL676_021391 [Syzygium grande]|nr:hypothetical protein NL676_021391 [Syzygium grande]
MVMETAILEILVPSWWEVKVTVATSVFVTLAYWFFTYGADGSGGGAEPDRSLVENSAASGDRQWQGAMSSTTASLSVS